MDPFDRPIWTWLTTRPAWAYLVAYAMAVLILLVS